MESVFGDVLCRVRHPEYTGTDRCVPCTLLNLYLSAVVGITIGLAWSRPAGVLAFGFMALLVYVRGYLVPGTPAITAVPGRVLGLFRRSRGDAGNEEGEETLAGSPGTGDKTGARGEKSFVRELLEADLLERRRTELRLPRRVHDDWTRRIRRIDRRGSLKERLDGQYEIDSDRLQLDRLGDRPVLLSHGRPVAVWPSRGALVADVALESILEERVDWDRFDRRERNRHLETFRAFLQSCPSCGASLPPPERSGGDITRSGNGKRTEARSGSITVTCSECGDAILDV
ncbi:MAG: hypothetical protein V5A46_01865 [Haloferacaceae archaeon]